ncbi:hypothetical protein BU15DRAFT_82210 [Melanogaster broomeanus]|nr:hypothetical protein BU15DRAFT_82210 [Melanogaster broomeanus]
MPPRAVRSGVLCVSSVSLGSGGLVRHAGEGGLVEGAEGESSSSSFLTSFPPLQLTCWPSSSGPSILSFVHDPPPAIWLVQPARWCCRPCARRIWVRGVSGVVAGHLGVLGHNVRVVDVSVPTAVVLLGSRRLSDVLHDVRGLVLGGWQWMGGGGSGDVTRGLASLSPSAGPWVWSSLIAQLVASLPLERHALGVFFVGLLGLPPRAAAH